VPKCFQNRFIHLISLENATLFAAPGPVVVCVVAGSGVEDLVQLPHVVVRRLTLTLVLVPVAAPAQHAPLEWVVEYTEGAVNTAY